MTDIVIITVQYGNFDDTERLAKSIAALDGSEEVELVVVDNSSSDEGLARLGGLAGSVNYPLRILSPARNLYYWGGAALALQDLANRNGTTPRWVVICNNDITLPDHRFLARLGDLDPARLPVVAPRIVSASTGKQQNPLLDSRPRGLKRLKWRIYDVDYRLANLMLRTHAFLSRLSRPDDPSRQDTERDIYAAHGACVILSSAFFSKGGTLDTTVPLFAEELTLAVTAECLGLKIRYVPQLEVIHREHSTTGAALTREKYEMERAARRRYYELRTSTPH
jgi:GT2 family glycosyltransferase